MGWRDVRSVFGLTDRQIVLFLFFFVSAVSPAIYYTFGIFEPFATFHSDFMDYTYPKLVAISASIHAGEFPLWNPFQGAGTVLFADSAKVVWEVPLLAWLSVPAFVVWVNAFYTFIALSGCYSLAKELEVSAFGAAFGAILFAFDAYFVLYRLDMVMLAQAAYQVWALYCFMRFQRSSGGKPYWVVLAGLALGAQSLYGRQTDLFFGLVFAAAFSLWVVTGFRPISGGLQTRLRTVVVFWGVAGAIGVAVAAFYLLPNLSFMLQSTRLVGGHAYGEPTRYIELGVFELFVPEFMLNLIAAIPRLARLHEWVGRDGNYFTIGLVPLPFLLAAWSARYAQRERFLFTSVGVMALLILPSGLYEIVRLLPLFHSAWEPIRMTPCFVLSICLLIGIGYDRLFQETSLRLGWALRLSSLIAGIYILICVALGLLSIGTWHLQIAHIALAIICFGMAWVSQRRMISARMGFVAMALLFWASLAPVRGVFPEYPDRYAARKQFFQIPSSQTISYLKNRALTDEFRVMATDRELSEFPSRYLLDNVSFYQAAGTYQLCRFFKYAVGTDCINKPILGDPSSPFYALLNTRYFIEADHPRVPLPNTPMSDKRFPPVLHDGKLGLTVRENIEAMPRVFTGGAAKVVTEADAQLAAMAELMKKDPDWFRKHVILDQAPTVEPQFEAKTSVLKKEFGFNFVALDVDTTAPSILVLGDRYDPDWTVTVDGNRSKLLQADYLFRGVALEAGSHRVIFRYKPLSVLIGAAISASAGAGLVGIFIFALWRRTVGRKGALALRTDPLS